MRSIWIPCLIAVMAIMSADARASRCVDQVASFAQRLDVSIGVPGQKKATALDAEMAAAPEFNVPKVLVPPAGKMPGGALGNEKEKIASPDIGAGAPPSDGIAGDSGLKTHAKSVLSNLLNAALAAGAEGRSRDCFEQLNVAHAVSLIAPHRQDDRGNDGDWR